MPKYFRAKVSDNISLSDKTNLLTINPLEPVPAPVPGQFYMMTAGDSQDPLLKRPFSYLENGDGYIRFLYAVKGKGTSMMKRFLPGKEIMLIGPLGKGYPSPPAGYTPLLIAGGIGIASLFPLAGSLDGKAIVLYGARTKEELLMIDEVRRSGNEVIVCTEDCSYGSEGLVTHALNAFLDSARSSGRRFFLYACGPRPMLKSVAEIAAIRGLPGCASLEEKMACGFGACLGCVTRTVRGYVRVCKDGPVFSFEDLVWDE